MAEHIDPHVLAKYEVLKKIGSGSYGHVFKVLNRKTRKIKALKKNFDAFQNSSDAQRTYREIMFLMQIKHPNIVVLEEVIPADNGRDIYLVFEFLDADLHLLIYNNLLSEDHIKYILYQIAKALLFLHSAGLVHRDVKPPNILINESCEAKLCDFGLVRSVDVQQRQKEAILTDYIATRWYRAPQNILGSNAYSTQIDVWGFGCLIAETIRKSPLFPGTSTLNQLQRVLTWTGIPNRQQIQSLELDYAKQIFQKLSNIKKIDHQQFFGEIDPLCLDLIQGCLQFSPQKRLKIQQIIIHPYLSQFYSQSQIIYSNKSITTPIDDNHRFTTKDYKSLIYLQIQKRLQKSNSKNGTRTILSRSKLHQVEQRQKIAKYRMHYYQNSIKTQQSTSKKRQYSNNKTLIHAPSQQLKKVSLDCSTQQTDKVYVIKKKKHLNQNYFDKSLKDIKVYIVNQKLSDEYYQKIKQKQLQMQRMKQKKFYRLLQRYQQKVAEMSRTKRLNKLARSQNKRIYDKSSMKNSNSLSIKNQVVYWSKCDKDNMVLKQRRTKQKQKQFSRQSKLRKSKQKEKQRQIQWQRQLKSSMK